MKASKFLLVRVGLGAIASAASLFVSADAAADAVDQPGEYELYASNDSKLYFDGTNYMRLGATGSPWAYIDDDIASDGTLSNDSTPQNWNYFAIGSTGYSGQLQISNEAGSFNALTNVVSITITAKIQFTGNSISSTCRTPSFNVTLSTTNSAGSWAPAGASYNSGSAAWTMTNTSFNVPAVTTGCGGTPAINAVNSALGLGGAGHDEIIWYGKIGPSAPTGS